MTSVLRLVAYPMLIQYALDPTNKAPCNIAFNLHSVLKWRKMNLIFPSTVMKLQKKRFYARLFMLTSCQHVNFAILCSPVKS